MHNSLSLNLLYLKMRKRHGHLKWWPGDTRFEIIVGAILTQQTTWKNVEKAITNLKHANCMAIGKISSMPKKDLESMVRPAGYFRQKAARLQNLCRFIEKNHGTLENFLSLDIAELREELLAQKGIGNETCDSIMLYAAGKPVFVIDAYTKRIISRLYGTAESMDYKELQSIFEEQLGPQASLYNDFHAQFVELGKRNCRKTNPLCDSCPLNKYCRHYAEMLHHA